MYRVLVAIMLFSGVASAREIEWGYELGIEAGLWGTTLVLEEGDKPTHGSSNFPTQAMDESVRDEVHGSGGSLSLTKRERSAKLASDVTITGLIISSGTAGLAFNQNEWAGRTMTLAHALAINNTVSTIAKHSFRRVRPRAAHAPGASEPKGDDVKSFPSAHSSNAFAAATAFHLLYPEAPVVLRRVFFVAAAVVGYSRMVADKHYFTDVAVGGGIGALSAVTSVRIFEAPDSRWSLRTDGQSVTARLSF